MKLKIVSLNVRLWTKENNPFKPHFWLWRTFKQARLFRRENPDIICLQEVEKPVGKFLLGVWDYKGFFTDTRIPIYVRKHFCAEGFGGSNTTNGHGFSRIMLFLDKDIFVIQNSHYSWEPKYIEQELKCWYPGYTIICGDMNTSKEGFINNLKNYSYLKDGDFIIYPKEPEGPTYISYTEPQKNYGDIDHFGYIGHNPPKAEVTILPDKVSDHFPILAKFEI